MIDSPTSLSFKTLLIVGHESDSILHIVIRRGSAIIIQLFIDISCEESIYKPLSLYNTL